MSQANYQNNQWQPQPQYIDPYAAYQGGYAGAPVYGYPMAPQPVTNMRLPQITQQQTAYNAHLEHAKEIIGPRRTSLFGGYEFDASEITFATQNPREKVFVMLRAHPITNFGWIVKAVFWTLIPPAVFIGLQLIGFRWDQIPFFDLLTEEVSFNRILIIAGVAYYSLMVTNAYARLLYWYFNLYLITNERIIDYNFQPLVSHDIVEARIENIEDVREKSIGFLPSLFGYGDIFVQTAAQKSRFDFQSVPQPSEVRDIIADLSRFARQMLGQGYDHS